MASRRDTGDPISPEREREERFGGGRVVPPAYRGLPTFLLKGGAVYGPIHSRRMGRSLGINLLPGDLKTCSFDCVYCQCDWTPLEGRPGAGIPYPSPEDLAREVAEAFAALAGETDLSIDAITLAGNGEPTLHPRFDACVDVILSLRDEHFPEAVVSVLSNGTELGREEVVRGLNALDERVMKLDAGTAAGLTRVDIPLVPFDLDTYEERLRALESVVIQTCFIRGRRDNTTEEEISAWLERLARIRPESVQIYPIARVPAALGLEVVPRQVLEDIARRVRALGLPVEVTT